MRTSEFRPDWVSAPGDTIDDILRQRHLSSDDFANRIGCSESDTTDLLQGRKSITVALARKLAVVLGASVEFWVSRDYQYRQDVARLQNEEQTGWLGELPLADMIRFGWLSPVPHPTSEAEACLQFFGVPDLATWRDTYSGLTQQAAFRTSSTFDSRPGSVLAWLRQGEIEAEAIECETWDAGRFRIALRSMRSLTKTKDPSKFIPALKELCAKCGVAVAIVRAPTGCRASGATRFLSEHKALLLLSFRYLSDDHFWFTFFHEAGHLLLHGYRRIFFEGAGISSTEEDEANRFSADLLVPQEFQSEMTRLPTDGRSIIRFAAHVGVSPGIIVGQLQHRERLRRNQLNNLKRRFKWSD